MSASLAPESHQWQQIPLGCRDLDPSGKSKRLPADCTQNPKFLSSAPHVLDSPSDGWKTLEMCGYKQETVFVCSSCLASLVCLGRAACQNVLKMSLLQFLPAASNTRTKARKVGRAKISGATCANRGRLAHLGRIQEIPGAYSCPCTS